MTITKENLENWFTYHSPAGDDNAAYVKIREAGKALAQTIVDNTPASADQTAAVRKVREAVMTANQARACKGQMSPGPARQLWRVADRVRFAHEHPTGPIRVVTRALYSLGDPMVEIEGMSGQFASHLFIAADYPADSIVPRREK